MTSIQDHFRFLTAAEATQPAGVAVVLVGVNQLGGEDIEVLEAVACALHRELGLAAAETERELIHSRATRQGFFEAPEGIDRRRKGEGGGRKDELSREALEEEEAETKGGGAMLRCGKRGSAATDMMLGLL